MKILLELEDFIPDIEDFYRKKHSGRKLQWHHHMSNGTITFNTNIGRFDLDGRKIVISKAFLNLILNLQLRHFKWLYYSLGISVLTIKFPMKTYDWQLNLAIPN